MNFIGSISPPSLADSMVHHLAAPKYYAAIEGFPFVAINPWAMPGLLHVLFYFYIITFRWPILSNNSFFV